MEDGNYAVIGYSQTPGTSSFDMWVATFSEDGKILWEKRFDRGIFDTGTGIVAAHDGGLIVVGFSQLTKRHQSDVWLIKLNAIGELEWHRILGGSQTDGAWAVAAMPDGGFVVAAATASRGAGSTDTWLLRYDARGALQWERLCGGSSWHRPTGILSTQDQGIFVSGFTTSQVAGREDAWLLRLNRDGHLHGTEKPEPLR